jgi:hypothetical protein
MGNELALPMEVFACHLKRSELLMRDMLFLSVVFNTDRTRLVAYNLENGCETYVHGRALLEVPSRMIALPCFHGESS